MSDGGWAGDRSLDPIARFYDRHPYPPPVADLDALAARNTQGRIDRSAHHLIWPRRDPATVTRILVAGCGTSQAARYALRHPHAQVVGVDVSATSIDHTRRLMRRHAIENLDVHELPVEEVERLDRRFDHVICTGVLHHLADPLEGLSALRRALAPGGALTLMVYGRHGRAGLHMIQQYCRMLGVGTSPTDLADLAAALRELPMDHPLSRLLRDSRDFRDEGALADALLNPRERAYSVSELLELLDHAGLRFARWSRQAPYLPDCGSISQTPHAGRLRALPRAQQYAAMELFRGTLDRHTVIAFDAGGESADGLHFEGGGAGRWVPLRVPTAVAIDDSDRLPPHAAAALLNSAHTAPDLVMFVDAQELAIYRAIDGRRTLDELGQGAFALVKRLWQYDLVVIDATREGTS